MASVWWIGPQKIRQKLVLEVTALRYTLPKIWGDSRFKYEDFKIDKSVYVVEMERRLSLLMGV